MKIFSILKIDDGYSVKRYPLVGLRIDPRAVSPNQSGVTTTPLDGVSVLLIRYLIFKYLNWIFSTRVTFCTSSTSFYASRIRFPTETQLKRAIIK
jgi:hypothetical protein